MTVMRRKQAGTLRKNANSPHVADPEVQSLRLVGDQDLTATLRHVLGEKVETTVAGVKIAAKRKVPDLEVPEKMQKNQIATAAEDIMVMMVIVIMLLLKKDQEMQTMNQMLMVMNQKWQEMRTMPLKAEEVMMRMKINRQFV